MRPEVIIPLVMFAVFIILLFDLYPSRCRWCGKWGWGFLMENRVVFGSVSETCRTAKAHPTCTTLG